jgi:CheY-like chemotaxis protein
MSVSILVVDDEPDVADLFRRRFRREARNSTYVMHVANSGDEALELAEQGDRASLDRDPLGHQQPEMDGLDLLAEIKQR